VNVDRLVASLAIVRDEELAPATSSPEAGLLFRQIVSTPLSEPRPRRRRLLLAAACAGALVVTPALALRGHIIHLFAGNEPAPPPVQLSFEDLQRGVPKSFQLAGSARKVIEVASPDGPVVVWAAPLNSGGFCYAVGTAGRDGNASTCTDRSVPLDPWPFSVEKPKEKLAGGPFVLVGYALDHQAASVRVRFDNGEVATVPLTWVSPPIDAAFFVLWVPKYHWLDGSERFDVSSYDANGAELARGGIGVGVPTG
jgi:hypothetical protein